MLDQNQVRPIAERAHAWMREHPAEATYLRQQAVQKFAEFIAGELAIDEEYGARLSASEREVFPLLTAHDILELAKDQYVLVDDMLDTPASESVAHYWEQPKATTYAPVKKFQSQSQPKTWKQHGVAPQSVRTHPILQVKPIAPPATWTVAITRPVATQIAGWFLGRPNDEWSALLLVDTHFSKTNKERITFVVREAFFCDAGEDSQGHSQVPATWHQKLITRLVQEGRDDAIPQLIGHIHSHNTLGAFWSSQDGLMVGARLDEMSAPKHVLNQHALSLVVAGQGDALQIRARVDVFERKAPGGSLAYTTYDPITVKAPWPKTVAVKDVLTSRTSLDARPLTHQPTSMWWQGDDDAWLQNVYGYGRP